MPVNNAWAALGCQSVAYCPPGQTKFCAPKKDCPTDVCTCVGGSGGGVPTCTGAGELTAVSGHNGLYTYTSNVLNLSTNKCVNVQKYVCGNGYYGEDPDTSNPCTMCPRISFMGGAVLGASAEPRLNGSGTYYTGNTAVTDCYISAGTDIRDANNNTYHFTSDCYYTE